LLTVVETLTRVHTPVHMRPGEDDQAGLLCSKQYPLAQVHLCHQTSQASTSKERPEEIIFGKQFSRIRRIELAVERETTLSLGLTRRAERG
jgi:hypothetical protein